jgi:maltokinase
MTEPVQIDVALDELADWIQTQRWYASKSQTIASTEIVETVALREDPLLLLALAQARFATGIHELYQLLLSPEELDALADPAEAVELLRHIRDGGEIETDEGRFSFYPAEGLDAGSGQVAARMVGVEQSNTSIVFDDRLVLKVFR